MDNKKQNDLPEAITPEKAAPELNEETLDGVAGGMIWWKQPNRAAPITDDQLR